MWWISIIIIYSDMVAIAIMVIVGFDNVYSNDIALVQ